MEISVACPRGTSRFLQLACSCIAFSVMFRTVQGTVIYWDYPAFRYLVIALIITAAWALLMFCLEFMEFAMGRKMQFLAHRLVVLICDWIAALLALSAGAAAAAITTANDRGGPITPLCRGPGSLHSFCLRSKVATAFALLTFFFFIPHLILSTIYLLMRLHEP